MQQKIAAAVGPIVAKLSLPGSKSISLRAILLTALANGVSELSGLYINEEVQTFVNALYQLGIVAQLDEKEQSCIIAGGNGKFPKKQASLWCDNAEAVSRFLLSACAISAGVYYFDGAQTLRERSISPLLTILRMQNVQFIPSDIHNMPFTIVGADGLEGGEIRLDGIHSAIIASSLLMIAPYARNPVTIFVSDHVDHTSIELTISIMAEFGVLVHKIHHNQFMVPVPQHYQARDYQIEPNLTLAVYFFAAAAITGGEITIEALKRSQAKQAEIKFLSLLERMGCRISETPIGITVKGKKELSGIDISLREFSDIFVALCAIAPFATTPTRITHVGNMRRKDSDRMFAVKTEWSRMGIRVELGADWIEIFPSQPQPGLVNSHHDYRIAIGLSLIGLRTPGTIINHAEYVNRAFPNFYTLWQELTTTSKINA